MKKRKFHLDAIRVQSFVTSLRLQEDELEKIHGNGDDGSPVWMCNPETIVRTYDQCCETKECIPADTEECVSQ